MSVDSVTDRFASVWDEFSADADGQHIENAFPKIPRVLLPAMCPAVVTFPGPSPYDYTTFGENILYQPREYHCIVAVLHAGFGQSEQGQVDIEPYFDAVAAYFSARPGLELSTDTDVVYNARLTNDGGYFLWEFPDGSEGGMGLFHAIDFTFIVEELTSITYQD